MGALGTKTSERDFFFKTSGSVTFIQKIKIILRAVSQKNYGQTDNKFILVLHTIFHFVNPNSRTDAKCLKTSQQAEKMVNSLIFQSAMLGLAERFLVQSNIEGNNPDAYYRRSTAIPMLDIFMSK